MGCSEGTCLLCFARIGFVRSVPWQCIRVQLHGVTSQDSEWTRGLTPACMVTLYDCIKYYSLKYEAANTLLEPYNIVEDFNSELSVIPKIWKSEKDAILESLMCLKRAGSNAIVTYFAMDVAKQIKIPLIAAGGIASGEAILAAMVLGADAVQIGSKFVASIESSAHQNFKDEVVDSKEGDTSLVLKSVTPVRLIRNEFQQRVFEAEQRGASVNELKQILGRARAKKGMFEGDIIEGELEIGQIASMINNVKPAAQIITDLISEYNEAKTDMLDNKNHFNWG